MRNVMRVGLIVAAVCLATSSGFAQGRGGGTPGMALTSTAWQDGGNVPAKHAQPSSVSPALEWTNVPQGTVSFVLLMHDPDVARMRTTEDILHWLLFNIPGEARKLAEGIPAGPTLPDGTVQLKNGQASAYRGPGAPANGPVHHYTIELFALDTKLELTADNTRDEVVKAMQGHILGKAVYVGLFKQPAQ